MANKMENLDLDVAHFMEFAQHLPGFKDQDIDTIEWMLKALGIVEVSTAFEQVLAKLGEHKLVSMDKGDLYKNGKYSDAKLSTVRTSSKGMAYSAPVTNIFNKTGALRVQVFERKQNKFYYFAIPRHAYMHIPKTSNIEIPFELDGTPRTNNNCTVNWWKYKVDTIQEAATKYS
jgi:hypothetical protein